MSKALQGKPDFAGFLRKKGERIKVFRTWWFEIRGNTIYYFKAQSAKKPSGIVEIGSDVVMKKTKGNAFLLTGEGLPKNFELSANNKKDMEKWKKYIQTAIENAKNKSKIHSKEEETNVLFNKKGKKIITPDDFEEIKVIGRGTFGKVVKVRKKDTGKVYAMKILKKEMIVQENMIDHILTEKEILSKVSHPFIVSFHFAFQTETKLYLVLEFLSGGEVFFHLKEEAKFSVSKVKFYISEILLALEYLHSLNIIYRDLKPENCVLNREGHVVITDFGLAKTDITQAMQANTFCGTPEYLAPEILTGEGHGKAVDWWSLGILLYEMLTGLPPFYSENTHKMYEMIMKSPLQFTKEVPKDAQDLLKKLLERDPKKRLGSGPKDGAEIRAHKFFKDINFDKMLKKKVKPPFIPKFKGSDDTIYFDEDFTEERLRQTVANKISESKNKELKDFDENKGD